MWADDIETPAYVYDLAEVRRCHGWLRDALPPEATLYYSVKANPHPGVLATLQRAGTRAEVCSPGEVAAALEAGYRPAELLYTGPGKRATDLASAITRAYGRSRSTRRAGSTTCRRRPTRRHRRRRLLRVNDDARSPGQGTHHDRRRIPVRRRRRTGSRREPDGSLDRPCARVAGAATSTWAATSLPRTRWSAQFAAPRHRPAAAGPARVPLHRARPRRRIRRAVRPVAGARRAVPDAGRPARQALSTRGWPGWRDGRPRVSLRVRPVPHRDRGTLLVRVLDVKRSHGKHVVVLESGINHLGGMSGLRRLPAIVARPPAGQRRLAAADRRVAGATGPAADVLVTGPLCTPLDTWSRAPRCPRRARRPARGANVGAYGL